MTTEIRTATDWYPMHVGGWFRPWRVAVSLDEGTALLIADMRVMKFKTFEHASIMAKYLNAPVNLREQIDEYVQVRK